MIILTGSEGFIGKNFLKRLKDEEIVEVEKNNAQDFCKNFQDQNSKQNFKLKEDSMMRSLKIFVML